MAHNAPIPSPPPVDPTLAPMLVAAVREAGGVLLDRYSPRTRPRDRDEMFAALRGNDDSSMAVLRPALSALRPAARWAEGEMETVPLSSGEWWVVDAVEGNVNHVHGMPEWCVSIALLHDDVPVLSVVHQPVGDLTYTAVRGQGAHLNGHSMQISAKTELASAIAATGQAEAGQESAYGRIGDSITAMLSHALLVRATVPSTFPLLLLAAGHVDVFWQYESVLPGIAAGALLVTEAGGLVTDLRADPWRPGSRDVVAAAPGVHAAAIDVLSSLL
jgi:myo-inositol-1(or 4)-monophosphatase